MSAYTETIFPSKQLRGGMQKFRANRFIVMLKLGRVTEGLTTLTSAYRPWSIEVISSDTASPPSDTYSPFAILRDWY
jgi:hypothetical protein